MMRVVFPALVISIGMSLIQQLILLATGWFVNMSLYRWLGFSFTSWLSLLYGSILIVAWGASLNKKSQHK